MNREFSKTLKMLRKNRKLSQKEFGKIFNLAESTISGYENGTRNPSRELIEKFADFFNVSVDYLLGRSDDYNTDNKHLSGERLEKILSEYELYWDDRKLTDEDRKKAIDVLRIVLSKQ